MILIILMLPLFGIVRFSHAQCSYTCPNNCQNPPRNEICTACSGGNHRYTDMSVSVKYRACPCAPKYYDDGKNEMCIACEHPCEQCQGDAHKCTECNTAGNRQDFAVNYECPCLTSYYQPFGEHNCQKCDPSCYECTTTAKNCLKCNVITTNRIDLSNMNNTCPCIDGFFHNNSPVCIPCQSGCATCLTSKKCSSCPPTKKLVGTTCQDCQENEYGAGANCLACSYTCTTCEIESFRCKTCPQSANRIDLSKVDTWRCPCKEGYFDDGVVTCKTCKIFCKTCELEADRCTSCDDATKTNRDDQSTRNYSCPCLDGYFENPNFLCKSTGSIDFVVCNSPCKTCIGDMSYECTSCIDNHILQPNRVFYDLVIGNCIKDITKSDKYCPDGLYWSQNTCSKCSWMCARCIQEPYQCLQCINGLNLNEQLPTKNCICDRGFDLVERRCLPACDSNKFFNTKTQTCSVCSDTISNCQNCIYQEVKPYETLVQCSLCSFGYKVNNGKCEYITQNDIDGVDIDCGAQIDTKHTYTVFNAQMPICIKCPIGCAGCVLDSIDRFTDIAYRPSCSLCLRAYSYGTTNAICEPSCFTGTLYDPLHDPHCVKCSIGCRRCENFAVIYLNGIESVEICFECISGFSLVNHQCKKRCSKERAAKLQGTSCNCIQCDIKQCPNCFYMDMVTQKCSKYPEKCSETSYYLDGRQPGACLVCPSDCQKCSLAVLYDQHSLQCDCDTCELIDKPKCSSGMLIPEWNTTGSLKQMNCQTCSIAGCNACSTPFCNRCIESGNHEVCLTCNSMHQLVDVGSFRCLVTTQTQTQSVEICPEGFYQTVKSPDIRSNENFESCESCKTYCRFCTSATDCILCQNEFALDSGECFYINQRIYIPIPEIVQKCPPGQYYADDSEGCQSCNVYKSVEGSWCMRCDGRSPYNCLRCNQGYYIDQKQGQCLPCDSNCQECNDEHWCLKCQGGLAKRINYNYVASRLESLCTSTCQSGELPLIVSEITENLDNTYYMVNIVKLMSLIYLHDDLMQRIPSSLSHDFTKPETPFGADLRGTAIYENDGKALRRNEKLFQLEGIKNFDKKRTRLVCVECRNRCKKCVPTKRLDLQSQSCVEKCKFPKYAGQANCELFTRYNSYDIDHLSSISMPFPNQQQQVTYQSHLQNLQLRLQSKGTTNFELRWSISKLTPSLPNIIEYYSFDSYIPVSVKDDENYEKLQGYLNKTDLGLLILQVPFHLLAINHLYEVQVMISSSFGKSSASQFIHVIDESIIQRQRSQMDINLEIVDFDLNQTNFVLFYYYDYGFAEPISLVMPFVRFVYYASWQAQSALPLWCSAFRMQTRGSGLYNVPQLLNDSLVQMVFIKPHSIQQRYILVAAEPFQQKSLLPNYKSVDESKWNVEQFKLDLNQVVNQIIHLVELQIQHPKYRHTFKADIDSFITGTCGNGVWTPKHGRYICVCNQISLSLYCENMATADHNISDTNNQLFESAIALLLIAQAQSSQYQYSQTSQVVSSLYTLTRTQLIKQTVIYYLKEIVLVVSRYPIESFETTPIFKLEKTRNFLPNNLGDVGLYISSITRIIQLKQWIESQTNIGRISENTLTDKQMLIVTQQLLLAQIEKLVGHATKGISSGKFTIEDTIEGQWKTINAALLSLESNKLATFVVSVFPQLPIVVIPTLSILKPFENPILQLVTPCLHPSLVSGFFNLSQPMTDLCGVFLYNENLKQEFVPVFDKVIVKLPYKNHFNGSNIQVPDTQLSCVAYNHSSVLADPTVCKFAQKEDNLLICECFNSELNWVAVISENILTSEDSEQLTKNSSEGKTQNIVVTLTNVFPKNNTVSLGNALQTISIILVALAW